MFSLCVATLVPTQDWISANKRLLNQSDKAARLSSNHQHHSLADIQFNRPAAADDPQKPDDEEPTSDQKRWWWLSKILLICQSDQHLDISGASSAPLSLSLLILLIPMRNNFGLQWIVQVDKTSERGLKCNKCQSVYRSDTLFHWCFFLHAFWSHSFVIRDWF